MDLEGGAPPGARASTAASKSSGAIARRGQPWGAQAWRGLGREEKPAKEEASSTGARPAA
jgi:hypothetical protein